MVALSEAGKQRRFDLQRVAGYDTAQLERDRSCLLYTSMFDVATTQSVAQKVHPPVMAYLFLGLLALVSAGLVGRCV